MHSLSYLMAHPLLMEGRRRNLPDSVVKIAWLMDPRQKHWAAGWASPSVTVINLLIECFDAAADGVGIGIKYVIIDRARAF